MTWADVYIDEMARQLGMPLLPLRTFGQFGGAAGYPQDKVPGCVIVAPGILGAPERQGGGKLNAIWGVGVGIVVADVTHDAAVARAEPYGAALRALLVQQGALGGFAQENTWIDEETVPLTYERDRVVAASSLHFEVLVEDVLDRWGGPKTAPGDPTVPLYAGEAVTVTPTLERLRPP